ncbi:MAG: hypothetical protein FJ217_12500, partial [Ignavibacteria bacterium]|nr:hypothetical protein [Ignavibacteria bacterium]
MARFSAIITLSLLALTAYAQPGPDVRVLSEDARSIVIEFVPVFSTGTVVADDGKDYVRFGFQNSLIQPGEQGSPILPYRAVLIHLPARQ